MNYSKLIIYTDGGARGNPGPAGIGYVIYDGAKNKVGEWNEYIGRGTNNQAEYKALLAAIKKAKTLGAEDIFFNLDSELVVKQLNREYKVKDKILAPLFVEIYNLTLGFKKVTFHHISRDLNEEADKLVNRALDRHQKGV